MPTLTKLNGDMRSVHEVQSLLDSIANGSRLKVTDRISSALRLAAKTSGSQGSADAAVLLRQVLRCDDVTRSTYSESDTDNQPIISAWLDIPHNRLFPCDFRWADFGLHATVGNESMTRVRADPWTPAWLECGTQPSVDHDVSNLCVVRPDEYVRGDPFLEFIERNLKKYRNPGQRAAVRSALLASAGSTLLVNMPTGSGKTLAILAPALTGTYGGSVSVVVVPTVSLALDQQRRYEIQNPKAPLTAYHGQLSSDQKADFRRRIRSGNQPILFTNPEALVTSLARPLSDAAAGGRLRLLAIDEAHIVASWGDAFRPQFHALAGLRTHLLRETTTAGHDAFRTILASATVTEETLQLLQTLFGQPGPFLHVGAPVVRPEPSYWSAPMSNDSERKARLLESLRHLPRPAIVYTTLRDESSAHPGTLTPIRLRRLATTHGFSRFAAVDGASSSTHRESVLLRLRDSPDEPAEIDLVFATSAFGLGIDVPDIRTIVHACIPESLDRYYQEVGRGGRDGRAMISLVIPENSDKKVARRIATPRQLTTARAQDRWSTMIQASESLDPHTIRIPLTAVPTNLDRHSDYNEKWNLLTISLMARAGALDWDFSLKEVQSDSDSYLDDSGWLTVRVLRGDHKSPNFWSEVMESVRTRMVEKSRSELKNILSALSGRQCTGELVGRYYSISNPRDFSTKCLPSCGGCTFCRRTARVRWASPSPRPREIEVSPEPKASRLYKLATYGKWGPRVIVGAEASVIQSSRKSRRAIQSLIAAGCIQLLVVPIDRLDSVNDWLPVHDDSRPPVMVSTLDEFDPLTEVGVPTLVFIDDSNSSTTFLKDTSWPNLLDGSARSSLFVILGPSDLPIAQTGLSLVDADAAYRLADLERIL